MGRRTDEQVRADVVAALKAAPVDTLAITVSMKDGAVGLSGELSSHSERLAAITAAKAAAAPSPVHSTLTVEPLSSDFRMTDADIAVEVARAIVQSDIPPGSIWFEVDNRIVTLMGAAATGDARARIRHLVQSARGVDFIDNRITIGVPEPTAP